MARSLASAEEFNELESIESEEEDSNCEDEPTPSKRMKSGISVKKYSGAAVYKTKFKSTWTSKWPFATGVKGDPYSYRCNVCDRTLSCAHQGEKDVSRHAETAQHKKFVKSLKNVQKLNFLSQKQSETLQEKVSKQVLWVVIHAHVSLGYTGGSENCQFTRTT